MRRDPSWLRRDALILIVMGTIALVAVMLARLLRG